MFYIRTLHDVILMHYHLRCMGTLFLPFLHRANDFCDFLVAFLHNIALSNWDLLLIEKLLMERNPDSKGISDRCRHLRGIAASQAASGPCNPSVL